MNNRMIYGIAILFSFVIYLFFIMPLDFSQVLQYTTLMKIGLLIVITIFPLVLAWLYISRGTNAFLFSVPFHFVGLIFLYREFYIDDQITMFDYSFTDSPGSLAGLENFLLYILISLLGIVLSLVFVNLKKH